MGSSEAIAALYRDYIHPMTPGPLIRDLLDASFDPEVQAPRIAQLVESNPLYSHYLQRLDILQEKVKEWRQEFSDDLGTERLTRFIVVLLGPAAIRNAVLSIWINRHSAQGLPRKTGAPFLVMPRTQLKYALSISDYCDENHIANAEQAYFGALCFDWISALLEKKGGSAKSERKYLEELWPQAVKAARIAYELAAVPEQMLLSGYVFPAVLLVHLGKVLMAATYPKREDGGMGWKDFAKHCDSQGGNAALAYRILEKQKFAWTHAEAAALCAAVFPQLCPAEHGVRYYAEPALLRQSDHGSFELALVVSSAIALATKGKAGLSSWQREELNRVGITPSAVDAVLNRLAGKTKK